MEHSNQNIDQIVVTPYKPGMSLRIKTFTTEGLRKQRPTSDSSYIQKVNKIGGIEICPQTVVNWVMEPKNLDQRANERPRCWPNIDVE